MNPDGTPAQGVPVVIEPGHMQGYTSANGMTKLPVNTEAGSSSLVITVSILIIPFILDLA